MHAAEGSSGSFDRAGAIVASSNPQFRAFLSRTLAPRLWPAREACGGAEALSLLEGGGWCTLLLDRSLPDLDVNDVVQIVHQRYPHIHVSVVDSPAAADLFPAASARDSNPVVGAYPFGAASQDAALPSCCTDDSPAEDERSAPLPEMIGASEPMRLTYRLVRLVAPRDTPVLVSGETGTGKELVARGVHALSRRSRSPFVVLSCAAIPEALLESELFGYSRGAFTGAFQSRPGRIQAAHGGTLLLDEIGELPLAMQPKLLRFLQEGELQPLGNNAVCRVDVRVIAATNADLATRVREGRFREDLFYRLMVFPIEVVALRKRGEDVAALADHFLAAFCRGGEPCHKELSRAARVLLERYSWPGNVRELRHVVERACILSDGKPEVRPEHVKFHSASAAL